MPPPYILPNQTISYGMYPARGLVADWPSSEFFATIRWMVVTYFGQGSFRLQSGETTLLVDPINNRLKADIVLKTLVATDTVEWSAHEILYPGEYELHGLEIRGFELAHESTDKFLKTIFHVHWEDMSFAFLGHLSKPLDPELIDKIGEPDVLFLPCGGGHFLAAEAAARLVKQVEPHLVIPSFLDSPKEFLKAMDQRVEPQEKLVFRRKDLTKEVGKVVVLQSSGA